MEKLKEKLSSLRLEADSFEEKAQKSAHLARQFEEQLGEKEKIIKSLENKLTLLNERLEKRENEIIGLKNDKDKLNGDEKLNDQIKKKVVVLETDVENYQTQIRLLNEK